MEKEEIIKLVMESKELREACEIVAQEGGKIDFDEPSVKVDEGEKSWHISWEILPEEDFDKVEFSRICVDSTGDEIIVYFDERNCDFYPPMDQENFKSTRSWPPRWWRGWPWIRICWSWSPWYTINTTCEYNYWCFFRRQRATYVTQRRHCYGSDRTQTRKWKLHCGC